MSSSGIDDAHFQEIIIHNIRLKMTMKNMIPADLARKSGISRAAVSKMLHQQISIGLSSLKKIAEALDSEPAELLEFANKMPAEEIFSPSDYKRVVRARSIFEGGFPPIKCLAITGRSWLDSEGYYNPAVLKGFSRFPAGEGLNGGPGINFQFCLLDPFSESARIRAAKEERAGRFESWTDERHRESKLYRDAVHSIILLLKFTREVTGLSGRVYRFAPYCTILASCSGMLYEPYHLGREPGWDVLGTELNPVVLYYNHTNRMFRILQDHFDFYFDNAVPVDHFIRDNAGQCPEFAAAVKEFGL